MRIKLTDKGCEVRDAVDALYQKHVRTVEQVGGINADEFSAQQGAAPARAVLDRSDPISVVMRLGGAMTPSGRSEEILRPARTL